MRAASSPGATSTSSGRPRLTASPAGPESRGARRPTRSPRSKDRSCLSGRRSATNGCSQRATGVVTLEAGPIRAVPLPGARRWAGLPGRPRRGAGLPGRPRRGAGLPGRPPLGEPRHQRLGDPATAALEVELGGVPRHEPGVDDDAVGIVQGQLSRVRDGKMNLDPQQPPQALGQRLDLVHGTGPLLDQQSRLLVDLPGEARPHRLSPAHIDHAPRRRSVGGGMR